MLLDGIRALLSASGLPASLWGEALKHMVWIRNRSPAKALDRMTPYEALYGRKPVLKGVREWGSLCWVTKKTSKIHERAEEGRWIGFDDVTKGHRIYWPTRRAISVEYDVNFTPAPDPPLLEGEIGEIHLDFDTSDETPDPPVKISTEVQEEPVTVVDQGDQEAVNTQNPDEPQLEATNDSQPEQSIEQPIPNPDDQPSIWVTVDPSCLQEEGQQCPSNPRLTAQFREQLANIQAYSPFAINFRFANLSRCDLCHSVRSADLVPTTCSLPRDVLTPCSLATPSSFVLVAMRLVPLSLLIIVHCHFLCSL